MPGLFWEGLALGFLVAAPVGPIALLCLSRTLARGWSNGFASGLGAATADAFYAGMAGWGVSLLARFLTTHAAWLGLVGGLWLGWLGLSTLRSHLSRSTLRDGCPAAQDPPTHPDPPSGWVPDPPLAGTPFPGLLTAFFSTLALTLTNPLTILFFTAAYSGLAAVRGSHPVVLAAGAFSGSALWWLVLTSGAALLRTRLSVLVLHRLNLASGLVILGFALTILVRAVR